MKKNEHFNLTAFLIGFLLVLIGIYMYGILKINSLRVETDVLNTSIYTNTAIVKNVVDRNAEAKESEQNNDLSKIPNFFIKSGQEFTLIQRIETICRDNNVKCTIQPVGIDPIEGLSDQFNSLHLIVSIEGAFPNLYKITSILENLPYIVNVMRVNMQADGENTSVGVGKPWREDLDFTVITSK